MGHMLHQAEHSVGSLPIVILTASRSAVRHWTHQHAARGRAHRRSSIGMVTELGPLVAGLMVAGRNASGMASELGSMT